MASTLTLVNLSGFYRGIAENETAVNIAEFRTRVEPEVRDVLMDKQNLGRGFAVGPMMSTISMSGEVGGSTGVMAATASTAFAPVNSHAYWGAPSTGVYMLNGEVTEGRDAWKAFSWEGESRAGIA